MLFIYFSSFFAVLNDCLLHEETNAIIFKQLQFIVKLALFALFMQTETSINTKRNMSTQSETLICKVKYICFITIYY